ncbi:hypothetical protein JTB14_008053 [Gonioctena quinquepunctata]|nr:hypothetical protein JTB14_008053 [Gonioctena quinquepunctata]
MKTFPPHSGTYSVRSRIQRMDASSLISIESGVQRVVQVNDNPALEYYYFVKAIIPRNLTFHANTLLTNPVCQELKTVGFSVGLLAHANRPECSNW